MDFISLGEWKSFNIKMLNLKNHTFISELCKKRIEYISVFSFSYKKFTTVLEHQSNSHLNKKKHTIKRQFLNNTPKK